jgi:phage shock protein A
MLDRWLRWMRGRLSGEIESLEDPELLLQQAQEEMRAMHAKNRERAVQAITQKNNLQQMVNDTQKTIEHLHSKANTAKLRGDADKALQFFGEIRDYEELLLRTEQQLEYAIMTSEAVKVAIKREEEKIRQKTIEALALKAQWKVLEVERSLTRFQAELNSGRPVMLTHEQITDRHARNERLATEAIAAKNSLLKMVNDTTKTVENLREKADKARKRGDEELERLLLREMEQYEASLAGAQAGLARAETIAERAKTAIQEEENWLQQLRIAPPGVNLDGSAPLTTPRTPDDEANVPTVLLLALVLLLLLIVTLMIWVLR